ncbi:MAG: peptidase U32 family protein [Lachnospiraceae bacterium]
MKKVELLAPAGNYECFIAAVNAGADAVYLGSSMYGARAFAKNFTDEEVIEAIYYAHNFGVKIYLTLNTLLKTSEIHHVISHITPFYNAGLDAVIVQEISLISYLKEVFPGLEIHVSTQMALTGPYGTKFVKELGAHRIVPARELSLKEIKEIKEHVEIDLEAFVHGAMCYAYSGQCLFSSFLGGRSGNRGKCAQACRLPYKTNISNTKQEEYLLSLKDMCTVEYIGDLIEAGIDSFKIEGRMKRKEYVSCITSIYRKYIDLYYENPKKKHCVSKKELEIIRTMFSRTDLQTGYFKKHNSKDMITLHKPSYEVASQDALKMIEEEYLSKERKLDVTGSVYMYKNQPSVLTISYTDLNSNSIEVSVEGAMVEESKNKPLSQKDIKKQLNKTGNMIIQFNTLNLYVEDNIFLPIKELNALRREAYEKLLEEIKALNKRIPITEPVMSIKNTNEIHSPNQLFVSVTSIEQLKICLLNEKMMNRLYINGCIVLSKSGQQFLKEHIRTFQGKIYIETPMIHRMHNHDKIVELIKYSNQSTYAGLLVSSLETYSYLRKIEYKKEVILNHNLYIWNDLTSNFWNQYSDGFCAPIECNAKEWGNISNSKMEYLVYGHVKMMVTANCIYKTKDSCKKEECLNGYLIDRYQVSFPFIADCINCYNIIYNSVPLSLHHYINTIKKMNGCGLRLDFTVESEQETKERLYDFYHALNVEKASFKEFKFTTGHFKKGAI